MKLKLAAVLLIALFLGLPAVGQTQSEYLDVTMVKVKPERRSEFDQLMRKMAAANRKNSGDRWLTAETIYGENGTIYFSSSRKSYDEVEKSYDLFMSAMAKGIGTAALERFWQDFSNCIASSRSELRRRRPDLYINFPPDAAGREKIVGASRWYRAMSVRVRPGHVGEYEDLIKMVKAAREAKTPQVSIIVTQSAAGETGAIYYLTSLVPSLSAFDQTLPTTRELLGEEGFQKYVKVNQEAVLSSETIINRFLPELSNPPEGVVAVAPEFWKPKPPAAPAKTKPAESAVKK